MTRREMLHAAGAASGLLSIEQLFLKPVLAQMSVKPMRNMGGAPAGFPVRSCRDPRSRGGVVVVDVPNGKEVTRELARREVLVDYRPNAGMRIAPHFYTSDDEIDRVIGEIRSIAGL